MHWQKAPRHNRRVLVEAAISRYYFPINMPATLDRYAFVSAKEVQPFRVRAYPGEISKRVIGDALCSRTDRGQATEAAVAIRVLKRSLELGRSESVRVA